MVGSSARAGPLSAQRLIGPSLALFAFAVGCIELGRASFWFDEAFSVELAERPLPEFVRELVTEEANQSLYFVLLRLWPLLGWGEVGPRLMSVLFTAAAAPLLYALGTRLYGRATGIVAALLLAVLPFSLQATQEARGYSLLMLATTAATYALVRADDEGGRWWAWYAICVGLLAYVHLYGAFVVLGQLVWAAGHVRERRRLVVALALGAIIASPMAGYLLVRGTTQLWFLARPDLTSIRWNLAQVGAGRAVVGGALAVLCAAGLVIGLWRARRSTLLVGAWAVVGLAVPLVYSALVTPIFHVRYLAGLTPAAALLGAVAITALPRPRVQAAAALVVAGALLGLMAGHFGPLQHEDWRTAVGRLSAVVGPGDQVIAHPYYEAAAVNFYRSLAVPRLDLDASAPPTADRIWVIGRADPPDLPGHRIVGHERIGPINIVQYAR